MNLQPVPLEDIPLGRPLPWRLYDRSGYIVFARGELVTSREQLGGLLAEGLLRDMDAAPHTDERGEWSEFREAVPDGIFPPAGIRPQIAERVQLRLVNRNPQSYYPARLIGYINRQSILVTTPLLDGKPLILQDGEQIEVRMVTGRDIYAFRTLIQRLCISPSHYMHLDFPAEVRVQQLRKSPWARTHLGVTVTDAQGVHQVARLVNLSSDGAQLHALPMLGAAGQPLHLALHVTLDELDTTLNLEAEILHVQTGRQAESNMLEYGIAFRNISAADALWLKGLVYRYIAEGHLA